LLHLAVANKTVSSTPFSRGVNSGGCEDVTPLTEKTAYFSGQLNVFAGRYWYQKVLPHTKFSGCSGAYYLSFCKLVWNFVSSIGLQTYDSKRKGQRRLFIFCFPVRESVCFWTQKSVLIATFILCSKRALSVLDGVALKNFYGNKLLGPLPLISLP